MKRQNYVLWIGVLALIAIVHLTQGAFVRTPFGEVHEDCVLQVPSGSKIEELPDELRITHPDGTVKSFGECAFARRPITIASSVNAGGRMLRQLDPSGTPTINPYSLVAGFNQCSTSEIIQYTSQTVVPPTPGGQFDFGLDFYEVCSSAFRENFLS
mgnify:CR=1 FL=1